MPRRVAAPLALLLVSLLACLSCGLAPAVGVRIQPIGTATATPAAVGGKGQRIAAPAGLTDRMWQVIHAFPASSNNAQPQIVPEGGEADVRIVPSNQIAPDVRVLRRWSVAAASNRIDLDEVSVDRLVSQADAGPLYIGVEYASLVAALFADASGFRPVPSDDIAARLNADPTALAIVPADMATVQVHVLALNGVDPVRGTGNLGDYPLATRGRVVVSRPSTQASALAAALGTALERVDPPPTTVAFTGDIIPTRCVYDQMRRVGDWAAPFRAVADRLAAADIVAGSLDASISDVGDPIGCEETFNLLAPPQVVQGFQLAHFSVMTVAANHAKDCGRSVYCLDRAFNDTLTNLRNAHIQPAGGGSTLQAARKPAVVTANGVRFAVLGYDDIAEYYHATPTSPGTAGLDLATLADDVKAAKAVADVVIVMPHWGVEYTPDPTERQQQAAKIAIQAGATMVVGNHPHVVQAALPVGDGYAAYALGNFVFDQDWSVETTQGVLMEAVFRGTRLSEVRFSPIEIQRRLQPVFLSPDAGRPILQRMQTAAAKLAR